MNMHRPGSSPSSSEPAELATTKRYASPEAGSAPAATAGSSNLEQRARTKRRCQGRTTEYALADLPSRLFQCQPYSCKGAAHLLSLPDLPARRSACLSALAASETEPSSMWHTASTTHMSAELGSSCGAKKGCRQGAEDHCQASLLGTNFRTLARCKALPLAEVTVGPRSPTHLHQRQPHLDVGGLPAHEAMHDVCDADSLQQTGVHPAHKKAVLITLGHLIGGQTCIETSLLSFLTLAAPHLLLLSQTGVTYHAPRPYHFWLAA